MKNRILVFLGGILLNSNCSNLASNFDNSINLVWELCDESFKSEFLIFEKRILKLYREKIKYNDNFIDILNHKDLPYNEHLSLTELSLLLCFYCENEKNEQLYKLINKAFLQGVDGENFWKPFLFYCWMANNKNLDKYNLLNSIILSSYRKEWESEQQYRKGTEKILLEILRKNNNAIN